MLPLIGRRLVLLVPTILLVTLGIFSLLELVPGDPATTLAGGASATPERIAEVREELGLSRPFLARYGTWLGDVVRLDFGESLLTGTSVTEEVRHRLPVTLSLVLGSMVVGIALGVPAGVIAGARQHGLVDRVLLAITSVWLSVPNFVLAILLVNYLSIGLGWFDAVGFTRLTSPEGLQIGDWLKSLTLPSIALGIGTAARLARQVRAGVVDTLHEPYVRTAWAKGCRPLTVVGKHVLKNAAIPAVTVAGLLLGGMLGGTVIVETVFAVPGMGDYLVKAVTSKDMPVIQGVAVMFVVAFAVINLAVDLIYGWLNPKVSVS